MLATTTQEVPPGTIFRPQKRGAINIYAVGAVCGGGQGHIKLSRGRRLVLRLASAQHWLPVAPSYHCTEPGSFNTFKTTKKPPSDTYTLYWEKMHTSHRGLCFPLLRTTSYFLFVVITGDAVTAGVDLTGRAGDLPRIICFHMPYVLAENGAVPMSYVKFHHENIQHIRPRIHGRGFFDFSRRCYILFPAWA